MTSASDRRIIIALIDEATAAGARQSAACDEIKRCICQLVWSSTQPEYIANRGTSGKPVSMERLGKTHAPD